MNTPINVRFVVDQNGNPVRFTASGSIGSYADGIDQFNYNVNPFFNRMLPWKNFIKDFNYVDELDKLIKDVVYTANSVVIEWKTGGDTEVFYDEADDDKEKTLLKAIVKYVCGNTEDYTKLLKKYAYPKSEEAYVEFYSSLDDKGKAQVDKYNMIAANFDENNAEYLRNKFVVHDDDDEYDEDDDNTCYTLTDKGRAYLEELDKKKNSKFEELKKVLREFLNDPPDEPYKGY